MRPNAGTAQAHQAEAQAEAQVVVETSLYQGVWSNRGASLRGWKLKAHLDENEEGLELISRRAAEVGRFPFSLDTQDADLDKTANGGLFIPSAARLELQSYLDDMDLTAAQVRLMLMFWDSQEARRLAESIQQMWANELGLDVELASQEWAVYLDTISGPGIPQSWALGWCSDYPDENNFVREVFASGGASNPTDVEGKPSGGVMWRDEAYERLVAQAAVETDPAKRLELYAQAGSER